MPDEPLLFSNVPLCFLIPLGHLFHPTYLVIDLVKLLPDLSHLIGFQLKLPPHGHQLVLVLLHNKSDLVLLLLPDHSLSHFLLLRDQPLLLLHVGNFPLSLGCLISHVFKLVARLITLSAGPLIRGLQGLERVKKGVIFLDLVDQLVLQV